MGGIHTSARHRELGDQLRKRREAAGITGAQIAKYTGWSVAKVSRIELGQREISSVDAVHYLGACDIYRGQAMDLLAEFRDAAECAHGYWLHPNEPALLDTAYSMIYHESTASASIGYEPELVPGLLQTENYIRALITARWPDSDIDYTVRVRRERQQILQRPYPAHTTFFINERALRSPIGDRSVMHEQLLTLTLLVGLPLVRIRVVPVSVAIGGPWRRFEFAKHQPLVCLDAYVCSVFLEDRKYVARYREVIRELNHVSLDERESRELLVGLADEYDRDCERGTSNGAMPSVSSWR